MALNSIKNFISQSYIEGKLIRAVIRQFGNWEYFQQCANDVANSGASAAWKGFTYCRDTVPFARRNKQLILSCAKRQADECRIGLYEFIGRFNCLQLEDQEVVKAIYEKDSSERANVYNALAWFALEEVAHEYQRIIDGE